MEYRNDTLKTIHERFSCRSFLSEKIRSDDLAAILQAGLTSPSSENRQFWRIIAVEDQALLDEIEQESLLNFSRYIGRPSQDSTIFYKAPCVIFIPVCSGRVISADLDCGIVAQTICLAASSLQIGNVIVGMSKFAFDGNKKEYFSRKLRFPEGFEYGISIAIGYPKSFRAQHKSDPDKAWTI